MHLTPKEFSSFCVIVYNTLQSERSVATIIDYLNGMATLMLRVYKEIT